MADAGDNVAFRSTDQMLVGGCGCDHNADLSSTPPPPPWVMAVVRTWPRPAGVLPLRKTSAWVLMAAPPQSAEMAGWWVWRSRPRALRPQARPQVPMLMELGLAIGVDLTDQTVSIGQNAQIGAGALGSTRPGPPRSMAMPMPTRAQQRVWDGEGSVLVGGSAVIDADANASNVAEATSTVADSAAASATINNDVVQAINLSKSGVVSRLEDLALDADAEQPAGHSQHDRRPGGSDQAAEAEVSETIGSLALPTPA